MSPPKKENNEPAPSRRSRQRSSGDGALVSFADPEALLKKPKGGQKTSSTTGPVVNTPSTTAPVIDTPTTTPVVDNASVIRVTSEGTTTTTEAKTAIPEVEAATTTTEAKTTTPEVKTASVMLPPRQPPTQTPSSGDLMGGFSLARRRDSTLTLEEYVRVQKLEREKREQEEEAQFEAAVSKSADSTVADRAAGSKGHLTTAPDEEAAPDSTTDVTTTGLFDAAASEPVVNVSTDETAASNSIFSTIPTPITSTATTTLATAATTAGTTAGNTPGHSEATTSKSTPASNEEDEEDEEDQTTKKSGKSILELFDKGDLDAIRDRVEFGSRRQEQRKRNAKPTSTTKHDEQAPIASSSAGATDKNKNKNKNNDGKESEKSDAEPSEQATTTEASGKRKASSLFRNRPASTPQVKRVKVTVPTPAKGAAKGKEKGKAIEKDDDTIKKLPRPKKTKATKGRKKRRQRTAEEQASLDLSRKRYNEERQANARSMWTSRKAEDYIFFYSAQKKYGWLSQWWCVTGFEFKGKKYDSAEQYMMYQKALLFKDKDPSNITLAGRIMEEKSQGMIRLMGRQVKGLDQNVWEENRERIVREGNLAKFVCSAPMRWALLSTGNKILVEASPNDTVWGIGKSKDEAARHLPNAQFEFGLNLLGRQLMIVREAIKKFTGVSKTDHSDSMNSLERKAKESGENAAKSELAAEDGPEEEEPEPVHLAAEDDVVMEDRDDNGSSSEQMDTDEDAGSGNDADVGDGAGSGAETEHDEDSGNDGE